MTVGKPSVGNPDEQHTRSVLVYYDKEAIDRLIKADAMLQVGWTENDPENPKIEVTINQVERLQDYKADTLGVRVWVKVEEDLMDWGQEE